VDGDGERFRITWKKVKGREKTDWQAVAMHCGATGKDVEKYTSVGNGYRRLLQKYGLKNTK